MKKLIKWALIAGVSLSTPQWVLAETTEAPQVEATQAVTDTAQAEAEAAAKAAKKAEADKKAAAKFAKCDKCHDGDEGMHGKHASVTNPNTNEPVTCTNCHGNPGPKHRKQKGIVDVMRFGDEAFPLDQQNGVCMSCHEPESLRKSLWAHDVHANKVTCTSCHQLHVAKEPVVGIPEKSRIKLCVDCHSKQHAAAVAAKKQAADQPNATVDKEAP